MRMLSLLFLAALAASKAHPDTATKLTVAPAPFTITFKEVTECPPRFLMVLTRDMPTPGWELKGTARQLDGQVLRIEITATPPRGMTPQVITPGAARVPIGLLRKGAWLVDVSYRVANGPLRRVQAFAVNAS